MKKKLYRLLAKYFGGEVKLVKMSEHTEQRIMGQMAQIEGIKDFWELHKQAGYQLYGRTDDKRYLGCVDIADTMITKICDIMKPKEDDDMGTDGYRAMVE